MPDMKDWYNKIAKDYDRLWFKGIRTRYYEKLNDAFLYKLVNFRGKKVLDLGCGTGRLTRNLGKIAKEVEAIDMSEEMLRVAREKNKDMKNIKFKVMNALDMKYEDNTFDVVVCLGSLESIPGFRKVFEEINRILKPGGAVVFSIHNDLLYKKVYRRIFSMIDGKRNKYYKIKGFKIDKLRKLLRRSNFKLLRNYSTFYYPNNLVGKVHDLVKNQAISKNIFNFVVGSTYFYNKVPWLKSLGPVHIVSARCIK